MKTIYIVSESFDKNDGQGVYKLAHYLYEGLSKITKVEKIEIGHETNPIRYILNTTIFTASHIYDKEAIYIFMCPELAWASKGLKNSFVVVEDLLPINFEGERKKSFVKFWKYCWNRAKQSNLISISNHTKSDILYNLYPEEDYIPEEIEDNIKNIALGVDKEQFKPKGNNNKIFTIGYVGGFGKRKNVEMVIEVAKLLPQFKFKIAGKGGNYEYLKSISPSNVRFVGYIDEKDLCDYYNSLDLFLYPDLMDGWSLPVQEAMACGVPSIVHNDSVFEEVISKDKTFAGVESNMRDQFDVKDKILKLISDKNELDELKKNCLIVSKEYDWKKTAKEYYNYLKEKIK